MTENHFKPGTLLILPDWLAMWTLDKDLHTVAIAGEAIVMLEEAISNTHDKVSKVYRNGKIYTVFDEDLYYLMKTV